VSRDPRVDQSQSQRNALWRAVPERILAVVDTMKVTIEKCGILQGVRLPDVCVCDKLFAHGKSVIESMQPKGSPTLMSSSSNKRKRDNQQRRRRQESPSLFSPTGISMNWQQSDPAVELVIGARGVRQGKKPKNDMDYSKLQSRLSRTAMLQLIRRRSEESAMTYHEWKRAVGCAEFYKARQSIFQSGPLAGWMVGSSESNFSILSQVSMSAK
jgi:hypothetical protein